jgi:uncharacterized membrane protein HdeD (DUF308 family)
MSRHLRIEHSLGVVAPADLASHRGWFLAVGILLMTLGAAGLLAAVATTALTVILLGTGLVLGGIIHLVNASRFWGSAFGSFFLSIFVGIAYSVGGVLIVSRPVMTELALTLTLAFMMTAVGLFRVVGGLVGVGPDRGLTIVNGVITLVLGVLIWSGWPLTGVWIIGAFVSIDLLLGGWSFVAAALSRPVRPGGPAPVGPAT